MGGWEKAFTVFGECYGCELVVMGVGMGADIDGEEDRVVFHSSCAASYMAGHIGGKVSMLSMAGEEAQ